MHNRYDQEIEQFHKTIELDPNFATAHFFLGRAYEAQGLYDKSVGEYFRMTMLSVDFGFDSLRSDPRFVDLVRKIGLPE